MPKQGKLARDQVGNADRGRTGEIKVQRHRNVFSAAPQLGLVIIIAGQKMTRLTGCSYKDRAVGVGKIIDAPIPRAMYVLERVRPFARGASSQQGIVSAAGGLADIDEEPQNRDRAQNRVIMGCLMRIAPA